MTVKIEGLAELDKLLKQLPAKIEGNIVRSGLNASARVIRDAARLKAPVEDGELKKSIRVSSKIDRKTGTITARIVAGNNKAFYAHFIEYGTASYYTGTGKSVRRPYKIKGPVKISFGVFESIDHPGVKPQPFMRPAFDENTDQALEAFKKQIVKRLEKL